jgi:hypothetical protein
VAGTSRDKSNELIEQVFEKQWREMAGDGPMQKQVLLFENMPENFGQYQIAAGSPERRWLSAACALVARYDSRYLGRMFRFKLIYVNNAGAIDEMIGYVGDAIEALKLELELDGREQIGNAYAAGQHYEYFRDLKEILGEAKKQLFIIDPYVNGTAFELYLAEVPGAVAVNILADRYSTDAKAYADKHVEQFGSDIELRASKEVHDRIVFVDRADCWLTGGSVKDAGKKPAYLIPAQPIIAEKKLTIYSDIWNRASQVL